MTESSPIYSLERGTQLVRLARGAITAHVSGDVLIPDPQIKALFDAVQGCFVTIRNQDDLRGCIGYPEPQTPLYQAIISAAECAASRDPRFPSITPEELAQVCIEVDLLTHLQLIQVTNHQEYYSQITIGQDGLLVEASYTRGLLLPQVATKHGWDVPAFLANACLKASLNPQDWRDVQQVKVYKFQVQAFAEVQPNGEIAQLSLH